MGNNIHARHKTAILRILRDADGAAVSSSDIALGMQAYGLEVNPRTVRYYLKKMEALGLVDGARRGRSGGRSITTRGLAEIDGAAAFDRVGFTSAKVDRLAWEMRFDDVHRAGTVVVNVTLIERAYLHHAVREMAVVFRAGLSMGTYAGLFDEGMHIGAFRVPPGHVGIATVCSVTLNGILLNARIPAEARFGAVLELRDGEPIRFTDLITYEGTTLDPLEIFIKARLTDVRNAALTGTGRIGVSFREVPTAALPDVKRIRERADRIGLGGILVVGKPNQPVLGFTVHEGRTGLIVVGGLNPVAAVEEAGIATASHALCALCDVKRLLRYDELAVAAVDMQRH